MSLPERLTLARDVLLSLVPVALGLGVIGAAAAVLAAALDSRPTDRKVSTRERDR